MGISGAGASAVAGIAKAQGFNVTGCDLEPVSPYSQGLKIPIKKGHSPSHLADVGMLILSPAVLKLDSKNKEVLWAKEQKIQILTWQEFQGKFPGLILPSPFFSPQWTDQRRT